MLAKFKPKLFSNKFLEKLSRLVEIRKVTAANLAYSSKWLEHISSNHINLRIENDCLLEVL